jgi:ribonucleoside-diphosphate reductase beta chain
VADDAPAAVATDVEAILAGIDEGLVRLPTHRELYDRWERQQWRVRDLDFASDRAQWQALPPEQRTQRLGALCAFFVGEESVTETLVPFLEAAPDADARLFLTTQLADEGRHVVFFERFFREALGFAGADLPALVADAAPYVGPQTRAMLLEALPEAADELRRRPADRAAFARAVTVYHLLVEATMALTGQRTMMQLYRRLGLFPAFQLGFTGVARDESRHVLFGVAVLRALVRDDLALAGEIAATVRRHLADTLASARPTPALAATIRERGGDPDEPYRFALGSLRRKLRAVGLDAAAITADAPAPSMPEEGLP